MAENFNIIARLQLGVFQKDAAKLVKQLRRVKRTVEKVGKSQIRLDTKRANTQIETFNNNLKETGKQAGAAGGKVRNLNKGIKQTSNSMKDVARRVFVWGALSSAIFGALQNLKELFTFTIKVNTAMGQLRKILPDLDDFSKLKSSAFSFAIEFGQDPADVITLLRRFAQSGLSVEESISAANTALLAMNVANISTEESMSALIGASRIFKIEFSEMEGVIDKIIAVERNFAVDSKDLIQSITAIGPAITVFGGDIDDLFSLIATLSEAARISGKEASNSLKRVLSRLASPEGINALQKIGVNVFKTANEFRRLRDILGDLAKTFPTLSDAERQSVAITLAQTRQFPKFLALLSNYDRALLALDISQRAFGESAQANEVIMATYEKRMATTSAEIKQFAEALFTSGVTDLFLSLKDALSLTLGFLNKIPTALITAGAAAGVFAIAAKGLKAAMFGFTGELASAQRGLTLTSLAMGNYQEKSIKLKNATGKLARSQGLAVTTGHRMASGFFLVGAALLVLAPLISLYYRKLTRGKRIQEKVTKDVEKFKNSLQSISFKGFQGIKVDQRFNVILNVFKDITKSSGTTSEKLSILKERLSQVFFGVETADLTKKQFDQLEDSVTSLIKKVGQLSIGSFFKEINSVLKEEIAPAADFAALKLNSLEHIGKTILFRNLAPFDFGSKFALTFESRMDELIEKSKLLHEEILKIGDEELNVFPEGFGDPLFSILNSAAVAGIDKEVNKTAEGLAKIILGTDILNKAARNAGIALDQNLFTKDLIDRAALTARVYTKVVEIVQKVAKIKFSATEAGRLAEELERLGAANLADEASDGIKLQQLSIASFLAAVKRSNFGVIKTFQAQLEIIKAVGNANRDLNLTFNVTNEVAKAASQAVNNLISKHAANIAKISQLENELKVTGALLNKEGFQQTTLDAILKKQNNITVELSAQKAIVKIEREHFDELLKTALKIEAQAKKAVQTEKQRENALKAQVTAVINYERFLIKVNQITINNPFESFKDTEDRSRRILSLQLEGIDLLQTQGFLEEGIADTQKEQLTNVSGIEESSRRMLFLQKQLSELYGEIDDQVDSIAGTVSGLITDQEAFLGFLDGQESFLEFLGAGFQDLAQAFTDRDAEVIANAIRGPLRDALSKEKEEIKLLLEKIHDPTLFAAAQSQAFPGLESSIILGHRKGGQAAADELIKALETRLIPQLNAIADKSGFPNSAIANLSTDAQVLELTKIEKNTKDVVDLMKGREVVSDFGNLSDSIKVGADRIDRTPELLKKLDELPNIFASNPIFSILDAAEEAGVDKSLFPDVEIDGLGKVLKLDDEKLLKAVEKSPKLTGLEFNDVQKARNRELVSSLSRRLGVVMAQTLAVSILGGDPAKVQTGANIGGAVGTGVGLIFGNPATGAAIGQGIGSIIGALFGKDEEEEQTRQLVKIQENTAQLVDKLSPEIFNAPSNFVLPSGKSLSGGVSINISNINVSGGGSSQNIANEVASALEDSLTRTFSRRSVLD